MFGEIKHQKVLWIHLDWFEFESIQFIAAFFFAGWELPQKIILVRESGPQNGRNIQVKDL